MVCLETGELNLKLRSHKFSSEIGCLRRVHKWSGVLDSPSTQSRIQTLKSQVFLLKAFPGVDPGMRGAGFHTRKSEVRLYWRGVPLLLDNGQGAWLRAGFPFHAGADPDLKITSFYSESIPRRRSGCGGRGAGRGSRPRNESRFLFTKGKGKFHSVFCGSLGAVW